MIFSLAYFSVLRVADYEHKKGTESHQSLKAESGETFAAVPIDVLCIEIRIFSLYVCF